MSDTDNLMEMFVFENMQLLEQLEELLLGGEKNEGLNEEQINETFRVMHTDVYKRQQGRKTNRGETI